AELAPAEKAFNLRRLAAEHFLLGGCLDEGLEVLGTVLGAVGLRLPATARGALLSLLWHRARLWLRGLSFRARQTSEVPAADLRRIDACWTASVGLSLIDIIGSANFSARQLLLALEAGEPGRVALGLAMEVYFCALGRGRSQERAERMLQRVTSL